MIMKYFTKIKYSGTKGSQNIVVGKCFKNQYSVMLFLKESYFFYKILVTQLSPRNLNLIYLMKIDFNNDHFLPIPGAQEGSGQL